MVSYTNALTRDGRKRAPRPQFGVHIVKPFPWLRVLLGLGGIAYFARREYITRHQTPPREKFLSKIFVAPYGVLGTQMNLQGGLSQTGSKPQEGVVIVDCTDLRHILTTAEGAVGASGAIYNMLGLRGAFPEEVVSAISRLCDAKFFKYGDNQSVIHVIGPDFREGRWSEREAALVLSSAYRNVLHEFVRVDADTLRVPPISSGLLAGPLHDQLPIITQTALALAFEQLHVFDREYLLRHDRRIELCVFMNRDWDMYRTVFQNYKQMLKV
ncbi:Macro domain [Trypanosoma vivax]|uniref:Macro domain-containing protein n=1 Tax=Trypanosoma vivax (strain Y486) TaxID=1055687 RepID=G0UCQ4_TRYVY|nr:hypothetical protein TRVL_00343 [Trypanosoma vivax]KAH8608086.1 Macro domain [Trypanosoma vivax]CCC53614.1 conserved hypothetical protein [Trypanosoma vivax Y486]